MNKKIISKLVGDKGFTIIELIVVIAIIAVLAAIVLVNVTSYISKSRDSAIQGNLATLLTNAAVYYDTDPTNHGTYTAFCTDTTPTPMATLANLLPSRTGAVKYCYSTATTFVACASLNNTTNGQAWCVDNTGKKGYIALDTGCTGALTACP